MVVDREEIEALGVRVHEADLVSQGDTDRGARHDAQRLAEEVCAVALVRL